MKRFVFLILTCIAFADYNEPPDWNDSNDFTHQSWDFNYPESLEPNGPALPVVPDGDPNCINSFGEPCLITVNFDDYAAYIEGIVGWMWDFSNENFQTFRRGYYGGMGNVTLTFKIPNTQSVFLSKKQLWIEMTYLARKDGGQTYNIEVATEPNFSDANSCELTYFKLEEPNEPEGNVSKWYRLTAMYLLPDQPQQQYVRLTAYHLPIELSPPVGGAAIIDQVDIDTRTISTDIYKDDTVNFSDFALLTKSYQLNDPNNDLFPDKIISLKDIDVLLGNWLSQN